MRHMATNMTNVKLMMNAKMKMHCNGDNNAGDYNDNNDENYF